MAQNNTFELLAPAGGPEALSAAVREGADAVYLGLKNFNARLRGTNFAYSQFEAAVYSLHSLGKKLYLALNTVWTEREADRIFQLLNYVSKTDVDGVIVQDFGTLNLIKSHFKNIKIHASTQMNCASSRACNALSNLGVSRVVLARELTFEEIKKIRNKTNIELEIFVHGALCASASGLCLFSSYLGGKSANRGMCTQACRRRYSEDNDSSKYYFSPLDLQLLEKIPALCEAGIHSFKIEGRMKSADYTGLATAAYRTVLDVCEERNPQEDFWQEKIDTAINKARDILRGDFARQKTVFYFDGKDNAMFLNPDSDGGTGIKIDIKNFAASLQQGDTVRVHRAGDTERFSYKITGNNSHDLSRDLQLREGDSVYLLHSKINSKHYAPVLPKTLSSYKKQPGHETAPAIQLNFSKTNNFPRGIYVGISSIEDMYIAQSARPSYVILNLNTANAKKLCSQKNVLPFKPKEIILNLIPFYNEDVDEVWTDALTCILNMGYNSFIINNIAQFSFFKNKNARLLAGPYLYSFNRAAAELLTRFDIEGIITPLENSRQNLEKSFEKNLRRNIFITVYAHPALFRIQMMLNRSNLSNGHKFKSFYGTKDEAPREAFLLNNDGSESIVTPREPFSITDKIRFLEKSGFKHFIVDFTPHTLHSYSKKTYKEVMSAAFNAAPIPKCSRFNWKNGFYSTEQPALAVN